MNDGQTRTLMVVHIPKAAGTTLRWIMDRQYPQASMFKIGDDIPDERVRLRELPDKRKLALRVVFGHMCWGWHEELAWGQGYQYLTMLREPTERVLSLYAYAFLPDHYMSDAVEGMGVQQYVESGVTRTCDNGMVRQLCGEDAFLREPYEDMVLPFRGVTRQHLETAKRNLERCVVVGLAEQFDATMDLCRQRLGWRIPAFKNQNITRWPRPKREEQDQATLDAIAAHNALDLELYHHARALFQKQRGQR